VARIIDVQGRRILLLELIQHICFELLLSVQARHRLFQLPIARGISARGRLAGFRRTARKNAADKYKKHEKGNQRSHKRHDSSINLYYHSNKTALIYSMTFALVTCLGGHDNLAITR